MEEQVKNKISELRNKGLGYKKIAVCLNMSANTVKSICRREGIGKLEIADKDVCKVCGNKLIHIKGKKKRNIVVMIVE